MASVTFTSWIAARIEIERSLRISMFTDPGSCATSPGTAALMASTVATVLASGWRRTSRVIERSPFTQLAVLVDSTLSSTSATSERRTAAPPGSVAMMSWA